MLMHGQPNGTISVMLDHFGSFVCAVSPATTKPVPYSSETDSKRQQQRSHKRKGFTVTEGGSFYMNFLYHLNSLFTGKQNK